MLVWVKRSIEERVVENLEEDVGSYSSSCGNSPRLVGSQM